MFYVYVLQSQKNKNWFYIGYSDNLKNRYTTHSHGKVKSTKGYRPLHLVYYEAYLNESDARKREIHLKTHQQKDILKERLKYSLPKNNK